MSGRLERVGTLLAQQGLESLVVINPSNTYYLSGFRAAAYSRPVIVIAGPAPALIIPELELPHAVQRSTIPQIITYSDRGMGSTAATSPLMLALATTVDALLALGGQGRIGFESQSLSYAGYAYLANRLGEPLAPVTGLVERLRMTKDGPELALMRRLGAVVDFGIGYQIELSRPGASELEIESRGNLHMVVEGGRLYPELQLTAISRPIAGSRSALPHALTSGYRIRPGDVIIHGVGVQGDGYWVGCERTVFAGRPVAQAVRLFEVMMASRRAALEAIRPGLPCCSVHQAALRVVEEAGLADAFLHRTGHGIGLDIHEPPYFSAKDQTIMAPGMVLSVEPGLYLAGVGGFRHADNIVITADGYEFLATIPRDLESLVLPP